MYLLLKTPAFIKSAKRLVKKNADLALDLRNTLVLLSENPHNPLLKTHKLKGSLSGSLACSAGYDMRVVFSFTHYEKQPAVLLEAVGTHDEVY